MPNIKISAATDAGTLLASDMLPLARSGDTNAYRATMAEIATYTGTSVSSGAYGNTGRNLLHNSMLLVQQRGQGPWTTAGYTADRWLSALTTDSNSVTIATLTDTDRTQIGDEAARYALVDVVSGNSTAGAFSIILQRIEGVRRHSGKTVTVSFWAKAAIGTPQIGVSLDQLFGTGGTPSAPVNGTGSAVTISATWARYSATFAIPSTIGKTFGTNGDDSLAVNLWLSASATFATRSGIGVQSGTFSLWGLQMEIGGAMTLLEKLDIALQLQECQRFYQQGQFFLSGWSGAPAIGLSYGRTFAVPMRTTPVVTPYSTATSNTSSTSLTASSNDLQVEATAAASGGVVYEGAFNASADL